MRSALMQESNMCFVGKTAIRLVLDRLVHESRRRSNKTEYYLICGNHSKIRTYTNKLAIAEDLKDRVGIKHVGSNHGFPCKTGAASKYLCVC